ncbi:hypothetical protein H0X10_02910 [Candidatus Saccharibacteria bacterium]|nr:hypothetical protein [Candidatus Saccharibacteria bacterium]
MEVLSGGFDASRGLATGIGASALAITSAFKAVTTIKTGEMGVRTRFGKVQFYRSELDELGQIIEPAPKIVGPGVRFTFPATHSINKISVQDRSNDLGELLVDRSQQYLVRSSVTWRVSPEGDNPYRALYLTDSLTESVTNLCLNGLRGTMMDLNENDMYDTDAIFNGVRDRCSEPLLEHGAELRRLNIHTIARSIGQMLSHGGDGGGISAIGFHESGETQTPTQMPGLAAVQ